MHCYLIHNIDYMYNDNFKSLNILHQLHLHIHLYINKINLILNIYENFNHKINNLLLIMVMNMSNMNYDKLVNIYCFNLLYNYSYKHIHLNYLKFYIIQFYILNIHHLHYILNIINYYIFFHIFQIHFL